MLFINDKPVIFQLDTGASTCLISKKYIGETRLTPTTTSLVMWNGSKIQPLSECILKVTNKKTKTRYPVHFIVVSQDLAPLLSLNACLAMDLVSVNEQNFERVNTIATNSPLKDFPDVFDDKIGTPPGTAHFEVDPSVMPVISLIRAVNRNLKPKIKKELAELVEQRVIAPTERATEWLSALMCTLKKNGEVRKCLDPRPLNKALKREHHHLPTLKEMLPELAKAKIFSTFDLRHGYWHVSFDEESSYLTTFDTPFGRHRWLRLPFGTKISSEMFQR